MIIMKIAVGTTSNQKLGYLQEILDEFEIKATLIPLDVPSEISEQPISLLETKQGSINRAKNAFEKCNNADFALGIEVGYQWEAEADNEKVVDLKPTYYVKIGGHWKAYEEWTNESAEEE